MTEPRVTPGNRRQLGLVTWGFTRLAGRSMGTSAPNLFTTLGRHSGLFWGWLMFAARLMPGGKLPRRDTELVILRVAHLRDCTYEWNHHVRLGRRAGVDEDDVRRITEGPAASGWSDREEAILSAVDEIDSGGDVSDATWDRLRSHLSQRDLVELVFLVGHYEMLATAIGTLRMQPDQADR
jgi:AhpD family alkylhydroperoxidase